MILGRPAVNVCQMPIPRCECSLANRGSTSPVLSVKGLHRLGAVMVDSGLQRYDEGQVLFEYDCLPDWMEVSPERNKVLLLTS